MRPHCLPACLRQKREQGAVVRFWAGFACGVLAVPAAVAIVLLSEPVEDLVMDVVNSEWIERRWG